jgi:hypothetical protein
MNRSSIFQNAGMVLLVVNLTLCTFVALAQQKGS